jgi:hypothetical protein
MYHSKQFDIDALYLSIINVKMTSVIYFYWIVQWFKLKYILIWAELMMRHMQTLLRWNLYHVALLTNSNSKCSYLTHFSHNMTYFHMNIVCTIKLGVETCIKTSLSYMPPVVCYSLQIVHGSQAIYGEKI